MDKVRVLIVDDHALVREGIAALLKKYDDIEVVGEAADGKEAIRKAEVLVPHIVLMDIAMPGIGGIEATVEIKRYLPQVKVLVLSQYDDREYVSRLLKAGISGYILKHAVGTDLVAAIRAVAKGNTYLYPSVASSVVDGYLGKGEGTGEDLYESLTAREKQVLKLLAEGKTAKEVAEYLCISTKTVLAHQANIFEKLGVHRKVDLVKFAIRKGIIKIEKR